MVLSVALIAGFGALIASRDDEPQPASTGAGVARVVAEEDLAEIGAEAGHSVYWAGEKEGTDVAVVEAEDGSIEVRYIKEGAAPESEASSFPTVVNYPLADPGAALDRYAGRRDAIVRSSDGGRRVVSSEEAPTSAYFVSPDNSVQVEVYDPIPGRALSFAMDEGVRPAG